MANKDNMSIEEMLAAARASDGEGQEPAADGPPAASPESPAVAPEPPSAPEPNVAAAGAKAAGGTKPSAMSVEEMLAAARGETSGGSGASPTAAETPVAETPVAEAPAAASTGPKKKASQMTMEEMLAAARGEQAPKAAPAKAAPAKAAAKPSTPKTAPKPAAAAKATGPKDTASILAAARSTTKPGPISKAELAAQGKTIPAAKKKLEVPPMPAKPSYARTSPAAGNRQEDRRGFILLTLASVGVYLGSAVGIGFGTLIVTHVLWLLGLARFMFPNILTEPPTKFKVGFPDELAPGQVATKFKAQFGVWIVRYEYDGSPLIFALQSVCTHLGCTPNWLEGEQKFKCPCHGSGFYKDGINFEGPAPRPLERFAIRLADDGQLEVDKSRKYKEEIGQWADPASYVPV